MDEVGEDKDDGNQISLSQPLDLLSFEAQEHNYKVKKPSIQKITQTGGLSIKFDSLRLIKSKPEKKNSQLGHV